MTTVDKNNLILLITNKIIKDGLDCDNNFYKYSIKPFCLSYRYSCVKDFWKPQLVLKIKYLQEKLIQ